MRKPYQQSELYRKTKPREHENMWIGVKRTAELLWRKQRLNQNSTIDFLSYKIIFYKSIEAEICKILRIW